jgi:hypothetical protein
VADSVPRHTVWSSHPDSPAAAETITEHDSLATGVAHRSIDPLPEWQLGFPHRRITRWDDDARDQPRFSSGAVWLEKASDGPKRWPTGRWLHWNAMQ